MNKRTWTWTIAIVALLMIAATWTGSPAEREASALTGEIATTLPMAPQQYPVLFYEVSGGTLGGLVHYRLSVYDSGAASISEASVPLPGRDDPDGRAAFIFVGPDVVAEFRHALIAAGATTINGGPGGITDTPLQTITFFPRSHPRAASNTFSFFLANGNIGAVLEIINAFIDEHFPGF